MKYSNYLLLFFLTHFLMFSCSSFEERDTISKVVVDLDTTHIQSISLSDFYSEIEFIPLDNSENAIVGRASVIDVSKEGIIVLDRSNLPVIKQFTLDGKYCRNIGRIGKAKGEFQNNVSNIAYSNTGDTIFIVTFEGLNLYDKTGSFISSKSFGDCFVLDFKPISSGYVYSTRYFGAHDNILHFWDYNFENVKDLLPTDGYGIGDWGFCRNPIRNNESSLYYYNEYNSDIYEIDIHNKKPLKCIHLSSKHSLSLSRFSNGSDVEVYDEPIDLIYSYMAHSNKLYGDIISVDNGSVLFELCMKNNELKLYNVGRWHPNIKAVYEGYCYDIIDQNEFLKLSDEYDCAESLAGMEKCNYLEIKDSITEKSNFIIVKSKLKYAE